MILQEEKKIKTTETSFFFLFFFFFFQKFAKGDSAEGREARSEKASVCLYVCVCASVFMNEVVTQDVSYPRLYKGSFKQA